MYVTSSFETSEGSGAKESRESRVSVKDVKVARFGKFENSNSKSSDCCSRDKEVKLLNSRYVDVCNVHCGDF